MKKTQSLLAKGLSLSFLTLCSRILGLIREMTKAKFLGTSALSDAFGIAFQVPNFFRRLFAENSVSVAFIPTFKKLLETNSPDGNSETQKKITQDFINATFTLVTFTTVLFVSLGMIFTPQILKIFFSKQYSAAMEESVVLTRIMFPYLIVISAAALFQGILNGLKIFSPSGFTPILFNSIVIAFTYLLAPHMKNPARAMSVGVIAGGCVQALFQIPFILRNNWKCTFTTLRKSFTNEHTRTVLRLIGPTIIGMAAYQLNDIVSSALATRAGEGVYSSIQYSLRLQELILGICAVTIGTVILPDLTGFVQKQNWESFCKMLTLSINIMAVIAIPITFYSMQMKENIITLIFASGKFNADSIQMTQQVFSCHIIGLFFIAVNRITAPAFYAQQDTKRPTIAGLANFTVNIILAYILSRPMGGKGIALALTIASAVNMILLFTFLTHNPSIHISNVIKPATFYMIKIIIFSIAASAPVYFIRQPVISMFKGRNRLISQGLPIFITACIFGITGIILMIITKDPLIKAIKEKLKHD
ncbi:MAG: murein biosynthesis integral membrane protein MurJ [Treponema sp.]|nr:murein biosynthesis integral membrane protein MurJ [Treponema sp.]